MKICVTGYRPNKMPKEYGYNIENEAWCELKKRIKNALVVHRCTEAITGMALGVDTVFAQAVLELKEEGYSIDLHCAIPCRNHASKWKKESIEEYSRILAMADQVNLVSDEEYRPYLMQKRNEYMVNLSDMVLAVWDGCEGGTQNCVRYAKGKGKTIVLLEP